MKITEAERVEAVALVKGIYAANCVGCCCHIVLDDGNVKDNHIEYCLEVAKERNHPDCVRMCELLLKMGKTQRLKMGNYG